MTPLNTKSALTMGISILLGLGLLGYFIEQAAVKFKEYDRIVTVKGLSEREVPADTVIWPIQFTVTDNDLPTLVATLDTQTQQVMQFLTQQGIDTQSVSISAPSVIDKKAQQYGGDEHIEYRYLGSQTLTVYGKHVDLVRRAISQIGQLSKQGIVFNHNNEYNQVEYLFSGLNDIKPGMIEEATKQAREVALKFAKDSQSSLGKIKRATQGQFSIVDRDNNTPYVKRVRVVSTVEYFLSD